MKLGIVTSFDAAHSLIGYAGKCKDLHGHTYTVEVIVEGEPDPETNFIIDYGDLKKIVNGVLDGLDHKYLNEIIDHPTSEMIAMHIRDEISKELKTLRLISVKVWEGKDKWVMVE
jgi:6-pyruvoyltetrahydropterin/6-carboxytetrahydropterin synthase